MPRIWIDELLEIKDPKNGEIYFYKIREVIRALKEMGMNIQWGRAADLHGQKNTRVPKLRRWGLLPGVI